jgi:hypothetical protein
VRRVRLVGLAWYWIYSAVEECSRCDCEFNVKYLGPKQDGPLPLTAEAVRLQRSCQGFELCATFEEDQLFITQEKYL